MFLRSRGSSIQSLSLLQIIAEYTGMDADQLWVKTKAYEAGCLFFLLKRGFPELAADLSKARSLGYQWAGKFGFTALMVDVFAANVTAVKEWFDKMPIPEGAVDKGGYRTVLLEAGYTEEQIHSVRYKFVLEENSGLSALQWAWVLCELEEQSGESVELVGERRQVKSYLETVDNNAAKWCWN